MDSRELRRQQRATAGELPDIEEWDKLVRKATDEESRDLEAHAHEVLRMTRVGVDTSLRV